MEDIQSATMVLLANKGRVYRETLNYIDKMFFFKIICRLATGHFSLMAVILYRLFGLIDHSEKKVQCARIVNKIDLLDGKQKRNFSFMRKPCHIYLVVHSIVCMCRS